MIIKFINKDKKLVSIKIKKDKNLKNLKSFIYLIQNEYSNISVSISIKIFISKKLLGDTGRMEYPLRHVDYIFNDKLFSSRNDIRNPESAVYIVNI